MTEKNTVTGKLLNGNNPQNVSQEIIAALSQSHRFGYNATFEEAAERNGELTIRVSASTFMQTIRIPCGIWRREGGIQHALADQLTI